MSTILIIFIIIALIVAIVAAEANNFIFTTAVIVSTFAALQLLFDIPIWAAVVANPFTLILFIVMYVAAGAMYTAVWRWPEYLREHSSTIESSYNSWLRDNKAGTVDEFQESFSYSSYTASANSNKLANWVLAWPFSLIWELSRKPAIALWNITYDVLGNTFTRIGKRVTNNILRNK